MDGTEKKFIRGLLGSLMQIDTFQNRDVDGRIIFTNGLLGGSVIGRGRG
jgi:hypothetical protein